MQATACVAGSLPGVTPLASANQTQAKQHRAPAPAPLGPPPQLRPAPIDRPPVVQWPQEQHRPREEGRKIFGRQVEAEGQQAQQAASQLSHRLPVRLGHRTVAGHQRLQGAGSQQASGGRVWVPGGWGGTGCRAVRDGACRPSRPQSAPHAHLAPSADHQSGPLPGAARLVRPLVGAMQRQLALRRVLLHMPAVV